MTAIIALLVARWLKVQQVVSAIGAAALAVTGVLLVAAVRRYGVQAVQVGDWQAPFGITLVADLFSAIMVLIAGIIGLAVAIYSIINVSAHIKSFGYFPLMHILLMGVVGAFLTGDLFNLYVCFEVMLIASFVLLVLGGGREQMEGAIIYVTMNLLSSALFLAAIGV